MAARVPIAKMDRVLRTELIIALERVHILPVPGRLKGCPIRHGERIGAGTAGNRSSKREEGAVSRDAVDSEVFDLKSVRESEFVSRQKCDTDVPDSIRTGNVS